HQTCFNAIYLMACVLLLSCSDAFRERFKQVSGQAKAANRQSCGRARNVLILDTHVFTISPVNGVAFC
ncbi:hypothetical protein, partial [Yersinia pestis]|uniref:hypothetical protein n=1 Tax=Yersinia pestis TaxID=632 RepID=UPI001C1E107F